MKILLSNDDGFLAPGINALREALAEKHHVITVAPDRDRSGASNSLTLSHPLRLRQHDDQFYSVNGTPTDCVHLGLTGLYTHDDAPDIVISGVNAGANLGDDVNYSGTVAAAMEGRFLGRPALAISLHAPYTHYETAVQVVKTLLPSLHHYPEPNTMILNVNVPDLPVDQLQGYQVTRLGQRHKAEPVIKAKDPRGNDVYWVGPAGEAQDAGEGTDFHAVQQGFVSITPLHNDLTRYRAMDDTANWLAQAQKD